MSDAKAQARRAAELAEQCRPIFAGEHPSSVGAALCHLVALHVAGHVAVESQAQTDAVRAELLERFVETVKVLVPILYAMEITPRLEEMQKEGDA